MSSIKFSSRTEIEKLTTTRVGEVKVGDKIESLSSWKDLSTTNARYILVGISEDIGVRANYGKPGASEAWKAGLRAFCNIQATQFIAVPSIAILGEIDCDLEMEQAKTIVDVTQLGTLVDAIDNKVSDVVQRIVQLDKVPIIIGGGHNNSYGNIKGASKGIEKPINCVNLDAHTDFRTLEHRHSGNGFSYAQQRGFLNSYCVFGLHRNYTSQVIFDSMKVASGNINYILFEDISVEKKISFKEALKKADSLVNTAPMAIELDMDAIANMGSSAMTPSGFTVEQARQFIRYFSKRNSIYFHICEGSPKAEVFPNQVGKTIAYLISDIIAT